MFQTKSCILISYNINLSVSCTMYKGKLLCGLKLQEKVQGYFAFTVHTVMIWRYTALTRVACRYGLSSPLIKKSQVVFIIGAAFIHFIRVWSDVQP